MSEWTIFGERLKKQLDECGMTYRELAEKVGLSVPTICRFVNCETVPRATEVLKIANVLGVNCNYLLGVIDDPYRDCPHHPKESTVAENATVQGDLIRRQDAIDDLLTGKEFLMRVLDDMDVVGQDREKYSWGLGLIESFIDNIDELPSAEPERIVCAEIKLSKEEIQEAVDDAVKKMMVEMRGEKDEHID